jgi:hypothetical protein
VAATAEGGTGEGGAPWAAGLVAFACSGPDDATGGCVASAFEGAVAFEGGVAPELKRSSLLGGWTALVVIIAPPANPSAIAAKAVPTPAK